MTNKSQRMPVLNWRAPALSRSTPLAMNGGLVCVMQSASITPARAETSISMKPSIDWASRQRCIRIGGGKPGAGRPDARRQRNGARPRGELFVEDDDGGRRG